MKRSRLAAPRVLPALAALALLGGCVSVFRNSQPPQQTYVLSLQQADSGATASAVAQPDTSPTGAPAGATLQVLQPVAVAGLGGDGIAVLRAGERLDFYTGAHWAAPAPSMLQTLIVQTLRRRGRFTLVESDSGPFEAAYLLSLDLTHFEADYGAQSPGAAPTVRVELVCALGRRSGRRELAGFTATSSVNADADHMQAVVAAFERATNDVLSQLASHIEPPASSAAATSAANRAPPAR